MDATVDYDPISGVFTVTLSAADVANIAMLQQRWLSLSYDADGVLLSFQLLGLPGMRLPS
jgi:hypothetical protein